LIGVDPWNYTLRELDWMARAKANYDWDVASVIWATIANTARDPKRKSDPFQPEDIHPFRKRAKANPQVGWTMAKVVVNEWRRSQGGSSLRGDDPR
jgi:hypothetical protein